MSGSGIPCGWSGGQLPAGAGVVSVSALVRHAVLSGAGSAMPAVSRRRRACSAAVRLSPVRRITPLAVM